MDKYRGRGIDADGRRKQILEELNHKLAASESNARAHDARAQKARHTIGSLKGSILSIFQKIGCNTEETELLTNSGDVACERAVDDGPPP